MIIVFITATGKQAKTHPEITQQDNSFPPSIYILSGVRNNLEVIQSLQEVACRRHVNSTPFLCKRLVCSQILVSLGGGSNLHFPKAAFQAPLQAASSSHYQDCGASLDATSWLCLVSLPTHPWRERAKGILPPYTGSLTKIPLCKAQQ